MPSMPRPKNKARKIAYSILGIPDNMKFRRSKKQQEYHERLLFEESMRIR